MKIKTSFEKSLTIIHHNFMLPEFIELQDMISIHALNLILSLLKRAASIGVNSISFGYIVQNSHNLPCAYE